MFREEESINIKIGFSKECKSDDSCTLIASMAMPSSTGAGMVGGIWFVRGGCCRQREKWCWGKLLVAKTVTRRIKSGPQGAF